MGIIRVLDESVANQIAAGEVVERPASVVKELLENALDAGAHKIHIRIVEGGMRLIEVQDDGGGIAGDDLELAFTRHATSKLRTLGDLRRSRTLGFRGEALPSIASVSRVTVRTRTPGPESGIEARFEGGECIAKAPAGCPVGTRVSVSDLYYNTPARLKFVRSLQTEAGHIADTVARAALARPDVSFVLEREGKRMFGSPGDGQLRSAFHETHGPAVSRGALALKEQNDDYALTGLLALPQHARAARSGMGFSVNGRPVRSPGLAQAVLAGFGTLVPKGRFPVFHLAIEMDPELVDVNVHPAKLEVRFSEERALCQWVERAVRKRFSSADATPEWPGSPGVRPIERVTERTGDSGFSRPEGLAFGRGGPVPRPEEVPAHRYGSPGPRSGGQAFHSGGARSKEAIQAGLDAQAPASPERDAGRPDAPFSDGAGMAAFFPEQAAFFPEQAAFFPEQAAFFPEQAAFLAEGKSRNSRADRPPLRAVAQVMKMYIVAEDGESVYLIDQHAAHERVLYERFRARVRERGARSRPLLVPFPVELAEHQADLLLSRQETAAACGLEFEPFGKGVVLVRAVPEIWEGLDEQQLVRDAFSEWLEDRELEPAEKAEDRIILKACKAAVKANQTLSVPEMDALLRSLEPLENPFTCPHGRPTAIEISRAQLERAFKRA